MALEKVYSTASARSHQFQALETKCMIVIDNTSFHKRVKNIFKRHGDQLLFLPSYIFNLNPIEKKWEQAKLL